MRCISSSTNQLIAICTTVRNAVDGTASTTTTTTTTTTTEKRIVNGDQLDSQHNQKTTTTNTVVAPNPPNTDSNTATSKTTITKTTTKLVGNDPSASKSKSKSSRTTTLHHSANAHSKGDNLQVIASGTADASTTQAAQASTRTVVQSDGAIVTSGKAIRSSTVKYAVEASSVQEKTIR